jgi:hypothetical protein
VEVQALQSRSLDPSKRFVDIRVTNNGSTDLYDLTWFPPLIQYGSSGKTKPVQCTVVGEQQPFESRVVETLAPGRSRAIRLEFAVPQAGGVPQPDEPSVTPLLTFVDVDEYRLGYVNLRIGKSDTRTRRGWATVGDRYPDPASVPLSQGELPA